MKGWIEIHVAPFHHADLNGSSRMTKTKSCGWAEQRGWLNNAAGWWFASECGVVAVVIGGVDPVGEGIAPFGVGAVRAGVSPFVGAPVAAGGRAN
jgi:hypothetical protein